MTTEQTSTSTNPQAGDVGATPQPQAGTTTTEPQAGEGQEQISLEEAKKLRSESANLRKRLKEIEAANAELKTFKEQTESAKLSEQEKQTLAQQKRDQEFVTMQQTLSAKELELQEVRENSAIQLYALQQGIDSKLATRLLDRAMLEHDDRGNPTNLDAAFKAMIKEYGLQTGKPATQASGGATNPPRSQTDGSGEITLEYVNDVMSGKIPWQSLSPDRRTAILNWQAKNAFRF